MTDPVLRRRAYLTCHNASIAQECWSGGYLPGAIYFSAQQAVAAGKAVHGWGTVRLIVPPAWRDLPAAALTSSYFFAKLDARVKWPFDRW
jgi:hypothetical protein